MNDTDTDTAEVQTDQRDDATPAPVYRDMDFSALENMTGDMGLWFC